MSIRGSLEGTAVLVLTRTTGTNARGISACCCTVRLTEKCRPQEFLLY